jgi:hypothetical protein
MARKLEQKLLRTARRKGLSRKQIGSYVYGTLAKIRRRCSGDGYPLP